MDPSDCIGVGSFAGPYTHLDQITYYMKAQGRDIEGVFIIVSYLQRAQQGKQVQTGLNQQGE